MVLSEYANTHIHWRITQTPTNPINPLKKFFQGKLTNVGIIINGTENDFEQKTTTLHHYFPNQNTYLFPGIWEHKNMNKRMKKYEKTLHQLNKKNTPIAGLKYRSYASLKEELFVSELKGIKNEKVKLAKKWAKNYPKTHKKNLKKMFDLAEEYSIPIILIHPSKETYPVLEETQPDQEIIIPHFGNEDLIASELRNQKINELAIEILEEDFYKDLLGPRTKHAKTQNLPSPELTKRLWFDVSCAEQPNTIQKNIHQVCEHYGFEPKKFAKKILFGNDSIFDIGYRNGNYLGFNEQKKGEKTIMWNDYGGKFSGSNSYFFQKIKTGQTSQYNGNNWKSRKKTITHLAQDPLTQGIPLKNFTELINTAENKAGKIRFNPN